MVPIENSVEGGVSATLDALASGDPLVVTGEVLVPVTFVLAAPLRHQRGTPCARSARTRARRAQVRGSMGSTCRMPCTCRRCRPPPPPRPSRTARSPTTPPCVPRRRRGCTGSTELAARHRRHAGGGDAVRPRRPPRRLPERTGANEPTVVLFQRDDHAGGCSRCSSSSPPEAST